MKTKTVSIIITTKNRKDELCNAIRSAISQSVPCEVLVVDDGSIDGTAKFVRTEFPSVRLERSERSHGYIAQRNRAARLSTGEIIFSIDDDAIFTSPYTVAQTLAGFDQPRVGAVAIPYIEPHKSPVIHQQSISKDQVFITNTFIGTAHALRKDIFLRLGGYREKLVHQGEEMDFCTRLLQAGYLVRLGNADPIHHMESLKRDFSRMDFYGRRNDILFAWYNVPSVDLPIHLIGTTINAVRAAIGVKRFRHMMKGTASGYADIFRLWNERQPVLQEIYRLQRKLKKNGPQLLEDIEPLLPSI